jgi:hypothetical protein
MTNQITPKRFKVILHIVDEWDWLRYHDSYIKATIEAHPALRVTHFEMEPVTE